jgi:CDP-4-dehydro-6-deoxyglucose reductase, E1
MFDELDKEGLKNTINILLKLYSKKFHSDHHPDVSKKKFIPGKTDIPYAGRVFDENEVVAAVESLLDFRLTLGEEGECLEKEISQYLGTKKTILMNSGSSANLTSISSLTSYLIPTNKRVNFGDEIITCAAGFPTTVAPIVQIGCIPVFVDCDLVTANIDVTLLEEAYTEGKTKAVFLAHTLGNPFNLLEIKSFCNKYNLWLIEDNCDSLGSIYSMPKILANSLGYYKNSPSGEILNDHISKLTGTWGELSTQSFYPPHHITMGEGGAVNISGSLKLARIVESFRDWGRDCYCKSGMDNTCGKRFDWQLGDLPKGYDHKYIYSHLGYNLKPLDLQAAIGRIQLKRLPEFIKARKDNWNYLRNKMDRMSDYFDFSLPTHATKWTKDGFIWDSSGCKTDCSWFGFLLRVKKDSPFNNMDLAKELVSKKIGVRTLFAGNLIRQPAFVNLKKKNKNAFRVVGNIENTDRIMNEAIFLGTFPGLSKEMIDYEAYIIEQFISKF